MQFRIILSKLPQRTLDVSGELLLHGISDFHS